MIPIEKLNNVGIGDGFINTPCKFSLSDAWIYFLHFDVLVDAVVSEQINFIILWIAVLKQDY